MRIVVTIRELFDRGVWMDYCTLTGRNEWMVNEGLASMSDEVSLSVTDAVTLGLIVLSQ